VISLDNAC